MSASWIRFAIAVVVVLAVVGLAALEMIAARPRLDTVVAGIPGTVDDWQGLRLDAAWIPDGGRQ